MRIEQLDKTEDGRLATISARVEWEDCERPPQRIELTTITAFDSDLSCNPNVFLLAAAIPAMHRGEQRVRVQGALCPQLRDGLTTSMQLLKSWFDANRHDPPIIEATAGFVAKQPRAPMRSSSFLSGGVDSMAAIRLNRRDFPLGHPRAIADGIFVAGLNIGTPVQPLDTAAEIAAEMAFLEELAQDENLCVLPVMANYYELYEAGSRFALEGGGAYLAAVAHAFPTRFSTATIASAGISMADMYPYGTHPFLDPNYSSLEGSIRHEGCWLNRLQKMEMIVDWGVALRTLRVCHYFPGTTLNCGRCDKCVRTMIELLLHDALEACTTFPAREVTPETIREMEILSPAGYLPNLIRPLKDSGRPELARALQSRLDEHLVQVKKARETGWRGAVKRVDRQYFGGFVRRSRLGLQAFREG